MLGSYRELTDSAGQSCARPGLGLVTGNEIRYATLQPRAEPQKHEHRISWTCRSPMVWAARRPGSTGKEGGALNHCEWEILPAWWVWAERWWRMETVFHRRILLALYFLGSL